jgi:hypothetical protein
MSAPDPDTHTKAGSITTSWFRDVYPAVNPKNDSVSQAGKVTIITGAGRGIGAVSICPLNRTSMSPIKRCSQSL